MRNYFIKLALPLVSLLIVANVNASVTLTLNDPNGGGANSAYCSYSGLDAYLNGAHDITGGQWIGVYAFSVAQNPVPVPNVPSPFYSICLSPGGDLDANTHTYNQMTPPASGSEINPGGWTTTGFQNASYLFSTYASAIVKPGGDSALTGSTADQGTALALAVYSALWNSTATHVANGTGSGSTGGFYITSFGDAAQSTDYIDMLTALNAAITDNTVGHVPTTTVLVPVNPNGVGSGQEFILQPVPEASTVFAGLLLLLPFGAGMFRVLRHSKLSKTEKIS